MSAEWWPSVLTEEAGRPLRTLARQLTEKAPPEGGVLTIKQQRPRLFEVCTGNPRPVARAAAVKKGRLSGLQDFQPVRLVRGMVFAHVKRDFKIRMP